MNTLNDIIRTFATSVGLDPDGPNGVGVTLLLNPDNRENIGVLVSEATENREDIRIFMAPADLPLHDLVR